MKKVGTLGGAEEVKTWADLDLQARNQVAVSMTLLQEFEYGWKQLFVHRPTPPHDDPPARFYKNALTQYAHGLFIAGPMTLLKLLEDIGMVAHANGIRLILETEIVPTGKTKLRNLITDYRDKYLSHPTFTHERIHKLVRQEYPEMTTEAGKVSYQNLIGFLYAETAKLQAAMLERFPEVKEHNRS